MRGGFVVAGVLLIILGVAWFIPLILGGAIGGLEGAISAFCVWLVLAPIFLIVGVVLLIVGFIAKSPQEVAAMHPALPPYYQSPPPPP